MYITGFVAFTFFAGLLLREGRGGETAAKLKSVGWEAWVWALAAFAATFTLLFTVFLTNPAGLWDGLYESLDYWLGQHEVGRGGEKPYFYVVVLFAHEWPVLLLAGVGTVLAFRQPTVLRAFLVWAFALSLAIYSWAGEKFAWLVLHPLLPLILLAGIGVQWMWENRRSTPRADRARRRRGRRALRARLASWLANAEHRADPREFLVSTQSSEQVKRVADEVAAMARKDPEAVDHGRLRRRRDVPVGVVLPRPRRGYLDLSTVEAPPDSDVLRDDRAQPAAAVAAAHGLHGPALPVPRLVGARVRQAVGGQLAALVRRAQAVEPDRRAARVPLRRATT